MLGIRASSGGAGGSPPPFSIGSLFASAEKGAYYDFTDATKLAVNADGTGGSPAIGAVTRWAVDQSPNGNHLRNTTGSSTLRRANGVETSGAGYGLFNMAGFGGWPGIADPVEIVATLEQKTFAATDAIIIGSSNTSFRQGSASGKARPFATVYGTEINPGLLTEFTVDLLFNGSGGLIGLNGGAMQASSTTSGALDALALGSGTGGGGSSQIRFKRLLMVGRALTAAERAGAVAWASA